MSGNNTDSYTDGTEQSATAEEIKEWREEHHEPHPIFEVEHRPERENLDIEYPTEVEITHRDDGYVIVDTHPDSAMGHRSLILREGEYESLREAISGGESA